MQFIVPVFLAADMIAYGVMATGIGFYFERPSSLFFGACDFAIAYVILKQESV